MAGFTKIVLLCWAGTDGGCMWQAQEALTGQCCVSVTDACGQILC